MITKSVKVGCPKDEQIVIGMQMENNHRQFVFDCSVFGEEVTSITLVHQRSKDEGPYPAATSMSDTLVWTITDTDTAYAGYGKAELRVSFANGLAKSMTYQTVVQRSITGDTVIPEPMQSWYDALIEYIDEHAATPEQIEAAVEAYLEEHPIPAPVQSVNGKTGDVVLSYVDVGAIAVETDPLFTSSPVYGITSADIVSWNGKSDFSGSYNDLTNKPTIPTAVSQLENDAGYITSAPVTSVNSKTGAVVISASDVGAYVKPSGGIPKSDLASAVQASLSKADSALQTAPVTSVNTKTGAVTLTANDVGALPSTYTAPVTRVDGQTGAVQIMPTGGTTGQVLTKTASGTAWQTPQAGGAVDSVNGQTGVVVLDAEDVGALPDDTTYVSTFNGQSGAVTYTAPVTSVNGQTGAVTGLQPTLTAGTGITITNNVISSTATGSVQTVNSQQPDGNGNVVTQRELTQAQYDALTPAEKNNGVLYMITDSTPSTDYYTKTDNAFQTKAITDTGGYYTTDTVEAALQEIGAEIAGINTLIGTGVIS